MRFVAVGLALTVPLALLTACAPPEREVVVVPTDVGTLAAAVDAVAPGGLILVESGTYTEAVVIDKPDVTLRGLDRNEVVIDGEGLRPEGVVVVSDGVRVQNLTVRNHTFNGVLVTGLHDASGARAHGIDGYETLDPEKFPPIQRFAIEHVTSSNNGLYGIYAFNAQHGTIADSYASGSADSGFYVGQCADCDILVTGNVAENNAVGFEAANASDSLFVVGNRWAGNRVGMTLLSNYQEAFVPQSGVVVAGNLIAANTSGESPAQAEGAFGIGIGIQGSINNVIESNRIEGNPVAGIILTGAEDLPATGNRIDGTFADNGVDVANTSSSRASAGENCVEGDPTMLPPEFGAECDGVQPAVTAEQLPAVDAPPGLSFLRVALPPNQPGMPGDLREAPDPLPSGPGAQSASDWSTPSADWWPRQ